MSIYDPDDLQFLRDWMPRGTRVFSVLRHGRRGGLQEIGVVLIAGDFLLQPNEAIARALQRRVGTHGGIVVRTKEADAGALLVFELSCALYDGDKTALIHRWI